MGEVWCACTFMYNEKKNEYIKGEGGQFVLRNKMCLQNYLRGDNRQIQTTLINHTNFQFS